MSCHRIAGGIVTVADVFEHGGFTFEFNRRIGPVLLRRDGEPYARQPGEKHPFWKAFDEWHAANVKPDPTVPRLDIETPALAADEKRT
jgi:hypothetical protein